MRAIGLGVLIVLLLLIGSISWLLCSGSGLRFALAQAQSFTHGALQVQQAEGRLIGPLDIGSLRYNDGEGTDVTVTHAHLDWRIWPLIYRRLHVIDLRVDRVNVALPKPQQTSSSSSGFSMKPPLAWVLDKVHVGPVTITQAGKPLFASDQLDLAGSWTNRGISLDQLALRAPEGHVDLDGQLGIGRRYRGKGRAEFTWKIDDTEYAGNVNAQSNGRNARLQLALTEPMLAQLELDLDQRRNNAWTAMLDLPGFDPKPLIGSSSLTRLAANLHGSGDQYGGSITGELDLNDYHLSLQPLQASFDKDFKTLTLQQLQLSSPQVKGQVHATGTIHLDAQPVNADLTIAWKNLELPAELVGQVLVSQGQLTANGSTEHYHAEGDVSIGPPDKLAKLALNLDGTPQQIQLHTLSLLQPQGNFTASGSLTLEPDLAWQLQANASKFDPGQLFAGWQGMLDADLGSQGKLVKNSPDVTLDLRKLDGQLRQRKLHGSGHLHLSPNEVLDGTLNLTSASSTIKLLARPGNSNDANVTLAIASLADWLPQTSGRLDGQFRVRGKLPKLAVNGSLQGQSLAWEQQRINQLQLQADIPDISSPGGKLQLDASGAELGGLAFRQVRLNGQGTSAQHQLTLDAQGEPLSTALTLSGSLKGQNWNGTLSSFSLDVQGLPRWRLQQATRLGWNNGSASLSELCLTAGEPELCISGNYDKAGNLDASYQLHAVPLTLVIDALGNANMPFSAEGTLEGNGKLRRNAAGSLAGSASITSPNGRFTYNEHPDQPALTYNNLALNATLSPGNQQISVRAALNGNGRLDGQASITGAQETLAGQIGLHLDNLAFVNLFTDALANVKGRLDGDFTLGGTVSEPAVTGRASVVDFAAEVPDAGLKLTDGKLSVSAADTRELRIYGNVTSGKGTLAIDGVAGLNAQTPTSITLKGSSLTVVDIPAAKVAMSPDLLLGRDAQGIHATGSVRLDNADVNLDKLPGSGVNKASPDIVIVDQPQQPANSGSTPIIASIKVDLGSHTHLAGKGLDGRLSGVLTVDERPGRSTTGQGQIAVNGTYKAYGQNLQIQQGLLLFASTPIDNPGLNIRALRSLTPNATINQGQQVGLQITGTAQRPVLTVFSNPVMDQSDALSYLVTGKPISQVKGSEGSTVNAAAQALGSATGNLLAKSIGSKLGISDIGVSSSDALNGNSAFTVGKYLSPRLYLSYGIGLFEPGQIITLRYMLSKRWNFEAQNATDFNRASVNYRIEK
ncbi:translocation/assembly module TamB domain-containing protein [Dyella flava]|uniref:Translocation/assembly module TamB domain-containing protein n=1 Tax=Dyella flava TaxID=1920170 RepID=A0ABS2K8J1_9GAMM|nr:translocation/assembly module TamB domain-containing protein [Dyella flava]MBM7126638.1 translocation/assembly module TamB domain-containing protein [Dyella flava]